MGELANINRGRPFKNRAKEYLKKGMHPIPLPAGQKFPPPTGWTGRNAPAVTFEQIDEWFSEGRGTDRSNIGLHMFEVFLPSGEPATVPDPEWDGVGEQPQVPATLVGIDVDHYDDKLGGDTLRRLEKRLGELPPTWTSSSRSDGISGIRYFLAPAKYEYLGKVGQDIECIQKKHRFAVVYPSWHPQGGQYVWYPPGCAPAGVPTTYTPPGVVTHTKSESPSGLVTFQFRRNSLSDSDEESVPVTGDEIPNAWEFPALPKRWVEHLTQEFQHESAGAIDMQTSVDGIYKWARKQFKQKGGSSKSSQAKALEELENLGCSQMRKRVEANVEKIYNSSTSHEELRDAHWEIFRMGAEGHGGWMAACRIVEFAWLDRVMGGDGQGGEKKQKRALDEAHREMFRSRTNGLRKIKAQIENTAAGKPGVRVRVSEKCACYEGDGDDIGGDEFDVSVHSARDPGSYERSDDGNGEHFVDLFGGDFLFVDVREKWMYWDKKNRVWRWDTLGMSRRAWRVVKRRQQKYLEQLTRDFLKAKAADLPEADELKGKVADWRKHVARSGNNKPAEDALKAASTFAGVGVSFTEVDNNPALIGVENGVIELNEDGYKLRAAEKEDLVVTNTGVPFIRRQDMLRVGGNMAEAVRLWDDYLQTFIPDPESQAWVQQVLGYCLFGRNSDRKLIFLYGTSSTGKSTMLNAVMHALGEYSSAETMDIFKSEAVNPQVVSAINNRVITLSEADSSKDISADMLKRMTGGDPLKARRLYSNDYVEKVPSFTPVIATNKAPQVDKYDDALKNRVLVIPFNHVVKSNSRIGAKIEEFCAPAVLGWLLEGWRLYCENHLENEPKTEEYRASRQEFENSMTLLGEFIDEYVEVTHDLEDFEPIDALYNAYIRFCMDNKTPEMKRWDKSKFGRELPDTWPKKVKKVDKVATRGRLGVKLKKNGGRVVKFSHTQESS
ncbi:DNA primase/polymerase [Gordonia phage LilyPad]|nr:DNA primase/polymerase [Gordonia phage LilyPad]